MNTIKKTCVECGQKFDALSLALAAFDDSNIKNKKIYSLLTNGEGVLGVPTSTEEIEKGRKES